MSTAAKKQINCSGLERKFAEASMAVTRLNSALSKYELSQKFNELELVELVRHLSASVAAVVKEQSSVANDVQALFAKQTDALARVTRLAEKERLQ